MTSVSEDVGSAPADPAGAPPGVRLDAAELHASVSDPVLTSMTLLNEIAGRYPDAVPSPPAARTKGSTKSHARRPPADLRTAPEGRPRPRPETCGGPSSVRPHQGFIHHLIARHLGNDERTVVDPEAVVVTTGCQEAMVLVLRALRRDDRDVVLAAYPAYVGFLGANPDRRHAGAPGGRRAGRHRPGRPGRADPPRPGRGAAPARCYVVPDFANPSGVSMSAADRRSLLDLAEREDILVLEDNPYSMFHSGGDRLPTVKSMDTGRRVVYFGSFAKTARRGEGGYVVADQPMADGALFADELAKLKSMLTLNTSTVAQAVVGGFLLENDCSVERATVREAQVYRRNLRAVLTGLRERFGDHGPVPGSGVSWNVPQGGMFVVVTLPFRADDAVLEYSADRFGVLWTPMHHFYAGDGGSHQIRLSFSVLSAERIGLGLDRLAALVADRVRPGTRTT
ncbi:PLP-dependent aminotransferase family protein [Streptomyces sp. SCUT-3]|uniref:PLP-dependent aminotransferase family protein n=1 Tax=Streptomyces sp. SCUT-3 TaxID=2684469 RepID=UPI0031FCC533